MAFMYDATTSEGKQWAEESKRLRSLDGANGMLEGLDMVDSEPCTVPKHLTVDVGARSSNKPFRLAAKKGAVTLRLRTQQGLRVVQAGYSLLPVEVQQLVAARSREVVLADGGSEHALGRIRAAYPRKGARIPKPITAAEAAAAWERELGTNLARAEGPLPAPLAMFDDGSDAPCVLINKRAGNGYPVMGKGGDPEAIALYAALAAEVGEELAAAYVADPVDGVRLWKEAAERERPYLVTLMGKSKGDYYKGAKLFGRGMRFYNTLGRHLAIIMQQVTQVVEGLAPTMFADPMVTSVSGAALTRGGAHRMVQRMERRLDQVRWAEVHMGDDSWMALEYELEGVTHLVMFALDCSSFDLTQHADLTAEVHKELLRINSRVGPIAAQLLYAFQRRRLVAVAHTLVKSMRHAGPSGLPMQSKVNGVVMGVALERTAAKLLALVERTGARLTESVVDSVLVEVGQGLGLTIRVEQYVHRAAQDGWTNTPILDALTADPFLFVGYNFYAEEGRVSCFSDLARMFSQIRYPTLKWVAGKGELVVQEAARLAGTMLSLGRPPAWLRPAFDAMREQVLSQVDYVLLHQNPVRPDFVQAVSQSPLMDNELPVDMAGLRGALERDWDFLWYCEDPMAPMEENLEDLGSVPRPVGRVDAKTGRVVPPSRAPTAKTAGRNPNTKVFGPAKPPGAPKVSRVHENAGWTRAQDSQGVTEDEADVWAVTLLEGQSYGADKLERVSADVEDFAAEEDAEFRRWLALDLEEAEQYLDDERWKL